MIYSNGYAYKEKEDYEKEQAELDAREAERSRPLDWNEYRQKLNSSNIDDHPSVMQLRLETVPEDQRGLFELMQNQVKNGRF